MNKKLLALAVSSLAFSAAQANSFLEDSPVEDIHIYDHAFTNPAFLGTTENQLSITDQSGGQIGWVNSIFGQKTGLHLGRDVDAVSGDSPNTYSGTTDTTNLDNFVNLDEALDLFWAANLGFGALGVNATIASQSDTDLVESTRASFHDGTVDYLYTSESEAEFDDGTDVFNLDVTGNESKESSRYLALEAGAALTDLPASVGVRVALPNASSSYNLSWTDTQNVGASGGGNTTARNIQTQQDVTSSEMSGLEASVYGMFNLSSNLKLLGMVGTNSETINSTDETVTIDNDDSDLNAAGVDTNETVTFKDSTEYKDSTLMAMVGARLTNQAGPVEIIVQNTLEFSNRTESTTYSIDQDTLVDQVTTANSTTGRTGVNSISEDKTMTITMPITVSGEWVASEKWTWRAGSTANLMEYTSETDTETSYINDPDNTTGFVEDVVNQTTDSTFLVLPLSVSNVDFGFSYMPVENVTIDGKFTKAFVEDGIANDGPVDGGSLAVTFRY